ncbi:MAG: ribosome-binding factor A [bacterium]|nr:ribosome-binding factor A [bacterium]
MGFQRYERVSSLILAQLNVLMLKEVEFDGALVTVTAVDVQKDLDYASVKISVIPSEKGESALRTLNQKRRELQHLLLRKINIRPMPEIRFELDHGLENAAAVEKAMMDIEKKD